MAKPERLDSSEKTILFFTSGAHFLTHFYMLVFPALVMPLSRDLGLSVATVLNISFWMYLLYGVFAMAWGWISDQLGHKWAMASGVILAGFGYIAAGLVSSPGMIAFCFAVVGVGCSAYHPAGVALVSQGVRHRGRAMGINGIWGNVGIAGAPFAAGMLNYFLGWRTGIVILGVMGLILGGVALIVPFAVSKGQDRKVVEPLDKRKATQLFVIFCVGLTFGGFMYRSFTLLLPAFLEFRLGGIFESIQGRLLGSFPGLENLPAFQTFSATLIATLVYLVGIIGQFVGGRVADRFSLKWSYFIIWLCSFPFLIGLALLPPALLVPSAGIFVMFTLGMQPIENSLVAYLTPARWRSVSYGVKFTLAFGAGSFAVKIAGAVEGSFGLQGAIWLVPAFLAVIIINTGVFLRLSRGVDLRH